MEATKQPEWVRSQLELRDEIKTWVDATSKRQRRGSMGRPWNRVARV